MTIAHRFYCLVFVHGIFGIGGNLINGFTWLDKDSDFLIPDKGMINLCKYGNLMGLIFAIFANFARMRKNKSAKIFKMLDLRKLVLVKKSYFTSTNFQNA